MNKNINDTLLKDFLRGNLLPAEQDFMNTYLKTTEGKKHLFIFLKREWDFTEEQEISDELMQHYRSEFWLRAKKYNSRIKPMKIFSHKIIRYAAVLTLFLLSAIVFYNWSTDGSIWTSKPVYTERSNAEAVRSEMVLEDGTKVYLGAGSSLRYPESFGDGNRIVYLTGEAFFEVSQDSLRPFMIHSGDIRTQVLGTSFRIKSFDNDVEVSVATGKVQVERLLDKGSVELLAILIPGQQLNYDHLTTAFKENKFNIDDLLKWKSGKIVFSETPFQEMIQEISRNYGLQFDVRRDDLNTIPITMTFDPSTSIYELLNSLGIYVGFNYSIENKKVIIE